MGHLPPGPISGGYISDTWEGDHLSAGQTVKQAGIELPDPTWTSGVNWTLSCVITGHLFAAHRQDGQIQVGQLCLSDGQGREDIQW